MRSHLKTGMRNRALHGSLGDTICDPDGNCYTDGVLTAAPLTTGPGCPPGVPSCPASSGFTSGVNTTALVFAGIFAAPFVLAALMRK